MIWLVRHGQTAFNAEGRIQGAKDSALTALGEEQGRRLGQVLGRTAPKDARIIASPLGRTQHTARIIREHGGEIEIHSNPNDGTSLLIHLPHTAPSPRLLPAPMVDT